MEHGRIQDQWQYPNQHLHAKPQSETSSIFQSLKGRGCSLHHQIKIERKNTENGYIKDQWPYPNKDPNGIVNQMSLYFDVNLSQHKNISLAIWALLDNFSKNILLNSFMLCWSELFWALAELGWACYALKLLRENIIWLLMKSLDIGLIVTNKNLCKSIGNYILILIIP